MSSTHNSLRPIFPADKFCNKRLNDLEIPPYKAGMCIHYTKNYWVVYWCFITHMIIYWPSSLRWLYTSVVPVSTLYYSSGSSSGTITLWITVPVPVLEP